MRTTLLPVLLLLSLLSVGCDKPAPAADVDASSPTAASALPSASSASTSAVDAAPPARPTGKTVETPAGLASEVGSEIQLAGKTIYPPPECPAGGKDGCAKV
ncbi:MAG TPA: hypothetical protein VLT33_04130, partial [Labilithrix sp.]|nr:hypothetical protein [Labilithrix sp.]